MMNYYYLFFLNVTDFIEERRMLLEFVGPELQTLYEEHQIEVNKFTLTYFSKPEEDFSFTKKTFTFFFSEETLYTRKKGFLP